MQETTFIEKGVTIIIGLIFLGTIFTILPIPIAKNFSDGERTGDIYKFSKKGLFFKSYEGEMYMGGATATKEGIQLEKFYFSIPEKDFENKKEIINKLKECTKREHTCTVVYSQWLKHPATIGSSYEVQDVIINK
jgi:hypothetical protein